MNAYYFMLITGGLSQKLHPFHQTNEYYYSLELALSKTYYIVPNK